ncbi:transporter substrate-binding domain-containing protein [Piscinibacter gummiphilus]|uniref:Uncharacterized protein n=1 Tax=Piscinibacter gummiphilus TaxID=946333 RepID=A0A1W6L9L9_9BURK|nr:transporter substrate-binding domain-containing protein [Piscinibacter gummiphilus]ARN20952.1 hypothetical protein A4W93_14170 [Piscinibacter gummiphilus]ATU65626.1 hypothetical protein CPZ87_14255 [Piscinibacter gummiphilus]GLS94801.1 ABC transporter substrate-binding protein [Piscinibacter gummiphilus]
MKRRIALGAAAALASPWALSATPRPARHEPRTALGRIRHKGTLTVAVIPQRPWFFADNDARWTGLDVDVANRLAADLGVKLAFVHSTWDGIADDVALGDADLAASLWPTARRALTLAFSDPYAATQVTLIAHREKSSGLRRAADFDRAEVILGVTEGLASRVARQRLPNASIKPFASEAATWQALLAGELHAVAAQTPLPEALAAEGHPALSMPLAEPLTRRREGFAVRASDADLLLYLNAWLRHQEDVGWLPERRLAWFGNTPAPAAP